MIHDGPSVKKLLLAVQCVSYLPVEHLPAVAHCHRSKCLAVCVLCLTLWLGSCGLDLLSDVFDLGSVAQQKHEELEGQLWV